MQPKIKFFYNNKIVESNELNNLVINNVSVDRIINDVVERNKKEDY